MNTVLKFLQLGSLIRNIYKVVCEEISKKNYKKKRDLQHIFIIYYITYEKERYLNLKNFQIS